VVFGNIDLSSNSIRTIHGENQKPGAGGWPTVSILTYSFFHTIIVFYQASKVANNNKKIFNVQILLDTVFQ